MFTCWSEDTSFNFEITEITVDELSNRFIQFTQQGFKHAVYRRSAALQDVLNI